MHRKLPISPRVFSAALTTLGCLALAACSNGAATSGPVPAYDSRLAAATGLVPTGDLPATGGTLQAPAAGQAATPTGVDVNRFPNAQLLTDTAWLADHMNDPSVRILDIRSQQAYNKGHIPGAVNIPVGEIVTTVNGVPFMFDQQGVQQALDRSGLTPDMTAVIYDDLGMLNAARMFWTLEYVGHADARILDGGWNAWNADYRQVSSETPNYQPSQYPIQLVPSKVVSEQELLQRLNDPNYIILDVRSPQEYTGKIKGSSRGGHIPGAINFPWLNDLTGGDAVFTTMPDWQAYLQDPDVEILRPASQIQSMFDQLGVRQDQTVVTHCQTFWRGAQVYYVLRLMGYDNVRGYDGAWAQWGSDPNTPIDQGMQP